MKIMLSVFPLLTITACQVPINSNTCDGIDECSNDITVIAIDENGDAVLADDVYWYYDPSSDAYDGEHPLECGDSSCFSWVLQQAPDAPFYVAGNREGPEHLDAYCGYSGYDGQPVDFTGEPLTIELDLRLQEYCQ